MTLSRRDALRLGLGVGAISLLDGIPAGAVEPVAPAREAQQPTSKARIVTARPLPLQGVRLLGGPLRRAQDADAKYLLALEPDRMLAHFRGNAGLPPRAQPYEGWDGGGRFARKGRS